MTTSRSDKDRPEAGADTESGRKGEGAHERDADSGGHRTASGGTYGDFVPDRAGPRKNDKRESDPQMGDYYTGGGNIDRIAEEPAAPKAPKADDDAERSAEDNRNKSFDTSHVHTSTTSRKI